MTRRASRSLALSVVSASLLVGCATEAQTPPPAFYITGNWACEADNSESDVHQLWTFHVTDDHVRVIQAPRDDPSSTVQWDYDYRIVGTTLTTFPTDDLGDRSESAGWTIELPEQVSYGAANYVRIAEGMPENLEFELTESTAGWTFSSGQVFACSREDD